MSSLPAERRESAGNDTADEILIIEDDQDLVALIGLQFKKNHYRMRSAADGREGLEEVRRKAPSLIILDLLLPGMSGWEVCGTLKKGPETKAIPLLILTALVKEDEIVKAMEIGADDYLTKPFSLKELLARVRALIRRNKMVHLKSQPISLQVGALAIDTERYEVRMGARPLRLTPTQFAILKHLALNPGKVFTRDQLMSAIWGEELAIEEHNIDVHIASLRKRLETNPNDPQYLLTVRGIGYKLEIER